MIWFKIYDWIIEQRYDEERDATIKQESQNIIKKLDEFQKIINDNLELSNINISWFYFSPTIKLEVKNIWNKDIDWINFSFMMEDNFWKKISNYWDKFEQKVYTIQKTILIWNKYLWEFKTEGLQIGFDMIPENTKINIKWIEIYDIHFVDWTIFNRDQITSEAWLYSWEHYYEVYEKKVILNNNDLK